MYPYCAQGSGSIPSIKEEIRSTSRILVLNSDANRTPEKLFHSRVQLLALAEGFSRVCIMSVSNEIM